MAKHKHYKLIKKFAKFAKISEQPHIYFQFKSTDGEWEACNTAPAFAVDTEYQITDAGVSFLERHTPVKTGSMYYTVKFSMDNIIDYRNNRDHLDENIYKCGMMLKTREHAEAYAARMLELAADTNTNVVPTVGEQVYIPSFIFTDGYDGYIWDPKNEFLQCLLSKCVIHLTSEAALAQREAMLDAVITL